MTEILRQISIIHNLKIETRIGDNVKNAEIPLHELDKISPGSMIDLERDDDIFHNEFTKAINDPSLKEADDGTMNEYGIIDQYIGMKLKLPRGPDGEFKYAQVKNRAVDHEGLPIGRAHSNPLLDMRQYEVEFNDGDLETMTANLIAENIIARVDDEGNKHLMMDEIEDHHVLEDAIPISKGTFMTKQGTKRKKRTTRGWDLLVRWKDGSNNWISLKDLKASYPIEAMEYDIKNNIQDEPAFAWWIPFVKRKTASIISKAATKYWDRTHKFGIEILKSVQHVIDIDEELGNTMWQDAIALEMKNICIVFEEYEGDTKDLHDYEHISGHLIFDVKLGENFRRKAWYVVDGYKTSAPDSVTYSSVISRDSVRMFLLLAAINGVDIQSADV